MRFINPLHAIPVKERFESELKNNEINIPAGTSNIGKGLYKFIRADVKAHLAITKGWAVSVSVKRGSEEKEEEFELTDFLSAAQIPFDKEKYIDVIDLS